MVAPIDLAHLNASQREAVLCTEGPLLVLAGAGSGKTRVITHRVAHLLERGVPPSSIVALSFTNKAAGEMRERLSKMVGRDTAGELVLSTFHSLGVQLLRGDPAGFGLDGKKFTILDQGDTFGIVRSLLREYGHHGGSGDRRFDIPGVVQRISLWKNKFLTAQTVEDEIVDEYDVVAAAIYGAYEDRLRSLGAVDFDDLVCLVARCLGENDELRERLRDRFRYVMVDEYQDTNDAQLELLQQLVGPPYNLAVVGDDDQAIYGWRGAKIENILAFDRHFPNPRIIKLEENYRSRAPILEAANSVIVHNSERHDKVLIPTRGSGAPVTLVVAGEGNQETLWLGKKIHELVVGEGVPGHEVAVLYRSAQQARAVEEKLQEHGLAYRVLGGQSLFDKKEVKDALAYLKCLVAPKDDLSTRRALETPPRGIGRKTMEQLVAHAQRSGVVLLEAVHRHAEIEGLPFRSVEALERFSAMIRAAQAESYRTNDVARALGSLLEQVALRDHIRHEFGSDVAAEHRWGSVQWFLGSIERFEQRARDAGKSPRWGDFINSVSLDSSSTKEDDGRGKITLATLHSSKGLEWDYVFLIGVEDGVLPHRRVAAPRLSDAISGDIQEERRLFYVGITRAREQLWLTRAQARSDRGREIPKAPSRFLEELPENIDHYEIAKQEELSSDDIGSMAAAFLAQIRPETEETPA